MKGAARRVILETIGWIVLLLGVAMLLLPGPGLLGVFGGLALLSQQYDWAERYTEPVKLRALKAAAEGVETVPRILASLLGVAVLAGLGILWMQDPPAPGWWPLPGWLWLFGGPGVGITQAVSALIALVLIGDSFRRFRGDPGAVAQLARQIEQADAELKAHKTGKRKHERNARQ